MVCIALCHSFFTTHEILIQIGLDSYLATRLLVRQIMISSTAMIEGGLWDGVIRGHGYKGGPAPGSLVVCYQDKDTGTEKSFGPL